MNESMDENYPWDKATGQGIDTSYYNNRDPRTGLYRHNYLRQEMKRLDYENQLPFSLIIGEINGPGFDAASLGCDEEDKLMIRSVEILKDCCRKAGVLAAIVGKSFSILLPKTNDLEADRILTQIIFRFRTFQSNTGDGTVVISLSCGCATKSKPEETLETIIKSAIENMNQHKLLQNREQCNSLIHFIATVMHEKSRETEEHSLRLIKYARAIGTEMHLSNHQMNKLELLSIVHDIGKFIISDSVLTKPFALSADENKVIHEHTEIGYRMALSYDELKPIAYDILCHHEFWNGNGYPLGLKATEIPLLARIVSILDAYDAMTNNRSYRKAMNKQAAIAEIKKFSGSQFDPAIADLFVERIVERVDKAEE